jgi:prolyl-tRNA editing enzyme YbaK/EbsC (Cys-tRNA(Pro) deacylase)
MSTTVLSKVREILAGACVPFTELTHPPTRTSEESAAVRGEPLGVGAKALLLRVDDRFAIFVLEADRKLDSAAVRRQLGVRTVRFASPDELRELTGLLPGSVPPFGRPVLPLDLYADYGVGTRYDKVAFNAGSLTTSIIMSARDWEAVARPKRFSFTK